jgi:hypothetical protein
MMKKVFFSLLVTLGIAVFAACGGSGGDSLYLALGDSLAVGIGAAEPERSGYAALFHQAAGTDRLANLAVGGENSASFIADGQLQGALATIEDPNTDVEVVTLSIGGNDLDDLRDPAGPCGQNPGGPACLGAVGNALASFADNYRVILGGLVGALDRDPGDEKVLVMTYYNVFSGTGSPFETPADLALLGTDGSTDCAANAADPFKAGLNDIIVCIGSQAGARVTVVDVYPMLRGRALELTHIATGDIHPTDGGHAAIAQAFRDAYARE